MNHPKEETNQPKEEMNAPNKNEFKIEKLVRFALDSKVFLKELENLNEKDLILKEKKIISEQNKLNDEKSKLEKLRKEIIQKSQIAESMYNEIQEKLATFAQEKKEFLEKFGK